ncbi:hypothetical protein DXT63_07065 [Thermoanaerobacteraceae bacterium SP2]|nr:hypothetical protein DXT63_07065 [Thermoanaerobacteraceae bacterium SP2]
MESLETANMKLSKKTDMGLFRKILSTLFAVGVIVFMIMGTIIVVVQLFGVITLNGPLTINISGALAKPAFVVSAVTGLLGFIQGYINGWDMGD